MGVQPITRLLLCAGFLRDYLVHESHPSYTVISRPLISYCAVLGSIALKWPSFPCALFLSAFKEISLQCCISWLSCTCLFILATHMHVPRYYASFNFTKQVAYISTLLKFSLLHWILYKFQKLAHAYVLGASSFIHFSLCNSISHCE